MLKKRNTSEEPLIVTSADLQVISNPRSEKQKIVRPFTFPTEEGSKPVPIIKLGKNQELDLDCVAQKGIGQIHAKWSPVSVCSLRYEPIIKLKEERNLELNLGQKEDIVVSCPRNVFEIDGNTGNIVAERPLECIYCFECLKVTEQLDMEDFITIEEGEFIFYIESNGSLKTDEICKSFYFDKNNIKIS